MVDATNLYSVIVTSVGRATPSSAVGVAVGLGLTTAEVINCLYRAPAVLIDKVEHGIAQGLQKLLLEIGYEVKIQSSSDNLPIQALFEVAVYLKEAQNLALAESKLASFIGMSEEEASKLLLTPPGTVLGSVSLATVESFKNHMEGSVEFSISPKENGIYDIFLGDSPELVTKRLLDDLIAADIEIIGDAGLIASGVPHSSIAPIWQRHQTNAGLRIINQCFLRYDILLKEEAFVEAGISEPQIQLILELTDIPPRLIHNVVQCAPINLFESVAHKDMEDLMIRLSEEHIPVQANLISFQFLKLQVVSVEDLSSVHKFLNHCGIPCTDMQLPFELPDAYPEIQARVLLSRMEQLGAQVRLQSC